MLLNWAAPGAYRTKVQKWQREVLGEAIVQMPGAIGVLLSPTYYHKKGNLWACEQAHLQMLSAENINTDRMVALLFKGKRDERDSRQQPRRETLSAVLCHWWTPLRLGGLFVGEFGGLGVFVVFESRLACALVASSVARRHRAFARARTVLSFMHTLHNVLSHSRSGSPCTRSASSCRPMRRRPGRP